MKLELKDLNTPVPNTWCPGCGNFGILTAVKQAIVELVNEGFAEKRQFTLVSGIGCHAKIYDYININGFYSIHGRVLPTALGIKVSNPELIVLGFGGDGDTYAEGIAHFVHACRYNVDMTMIAHNNQVFALTTGQATPTTERGFKGKSTPLGTFEQPLNPIALAIVSGATFVAREFALDVQHLKETVKAAVKHKGFAFIDVLQPCVSYHNMAEFVRTHAYRLEDVGHNPRDYSEALKKALEWDYEYKEDARIPLGIFYITERETYESVWPATRPFYKVRREPDIEKILAKHYVSP